MYVKISKKISKVKGVIKLTPSKSEGDRALIIHALCKGKKPEIKNLSDSDDTKIFLKALSSRSTEIDVGNCGTAMRFLTAYFSIGKKEIILTGSDRMKQRPIGGLVEALNHLGAHITYLENEGYPPLHISGREYYGKEVKISGDVSSQFVTALLLIAPYLPQGLVLHLQGNISSKPYILMTLGLMHHFGVEAIWESNTITVLPQQYKPVEFIVDADWSAASYWYEIAAFADEVDLLLQGLQLRSFQGDEAIAAIMRDLGVSTTFTQSGVKLSKGKIKTEKIHRDCSHFPDLVQTIAVTCASLGVDAELTGLDSLRIKETDRLVALQNELQKLGHIVIIEKNNKLKIKSNPAEFTEEIKIETYDDHRMVMAFAPLALKQGNILIENPNVVSKSYPNYWDDLKSTGFELSFKK
ncbi:MAG: 3-phosphoshikimate 1-carboxyvinyltransferase [Bacteroidia bacterium]